MTMQTINSGVRTKVEGVAYDLWVYQNSGAVSWVDVDAARIVCGPVPDGCQWQAYMSSGAPANLDALAEPDAVVVQWQDDPP